MAKPNLEILNKHFGHLRYHVQKVLPAVYDDSLSYYELLGKLMDRTNELGVTTNNLSDLWEKIYQWILGEGLEEAVGEQLTQWMSDGTLDVIIREQLLLIGQDLQSERVNVLYPPPPFVSVKGDGVTDDTTALQTLLNNFTSLYFPEGTYVTTGLQLRDNTTIVGKGTIKISGSGYWGMQATQKSNIKISGLKFDGCGVQTTDGKNVSVKDCEFYNVPTRPALELGGISNFKIEDNYIHEIRMGIHILNSNTGVIDSNIIENIGGGRSNGVNQSQLGQIAILLWGNSDSLYNPVEKVTRDITVSNNICRNGSDNGIRLIAEKYHIAGGTNSGQLYNCSVIGNQVDMMYIDGIRVTCDDTVIASNTIRRCSYGGIRGNGGKGLIIEGNNIQGDSSSAFGINIGLVHANSSGSNNIVNDNVVTGCEQGIAVFGGVMEGSTVETFFYDLVCKGNIVTANRTVGLTTFKVVGGIIGDNIIKGNGTTGVDLSGQYLTFSNNQIEGNNTSNNTDSKFGLRANATDSSIINNRFINQVNGTAFQQRAERVLEYGNTFRGNASDTDLFSVAYTPLETNGSISIGRKQPTTPKEGMMYFDGNGIRFYQGGAWKFVRTFDTLA